MVIRIDKGVARYGLPGLILGIGLAWVFGSPRAGSGGTDRAGRAASGELGAGRRKQIGRRNGRSPAEKSTGRWP